MHVPTVHPVRAAKEIATINHISRGRFALNIVAGWNEPEIRMFGVSQREHDQRYAYADEFTTLLKRLWTENEFDFSGNFFYRARRLLQPKPLQRPWPLIMSAGNSPAGRDFAARHADLNFALGPDLPTLATTCADINASRASAMGVRSACSRWATWSAARPSARRFAIATITSRKRATSSPRTICSRP